MFPVLLVLAGLGLAFAASTSANRGKAEYTQGLDTTDPITAIQYAFTLDGYGLHSWARDVREHSIALFGGDLSWEPILQPLPLYLQVAIVKAFESRDPTRIASVGVQVTQAGFPEVGSRLATTANVLQHGG